MELQWVHGPKKHCSGDTRSAARSSLLGEKQRRKLMQVVAPVDPRMTAAGFPGNHNEPVALKHGNRGWRGLQQEVFFADAEPPQAQPLLQVRVVQNRLVLLSPLRVRRPSPE